MATAANRLGEKDPYTLQGALSIFPRLADRMNHFGNQLSGGEQQMLSVVRALMTNPKLLIMDEATEGLAPLVRKEIWRGLTVIKNYGQSILIIDKNLDELMKIADRHYIMEKGRVVWSGDTAQLSADDQLTSHYLGV
jgi:branched-chain amino acid transport system ATP-binding protein